MGKILITGGCGFVGRHFVQRLLPQGHEIHCVDIMEPLSGALEPEAWPLFQPLDFDSFHYAKEDCRDWFKQHQETDFDYAFHLAAMVGGRAMIENNPLAVADDLSIDAEYWQWAAKAKPEKTIVFSSSAAYPIHLQRPDHYVLLKEDMISFDEKLGMPDLTYGWAKLTHEYCARLAYEKHGLKSVSYRPFSGYGEDQDDTYPFPSICKRVLANQGAKEIGVWGTGRQMRDFIHIDDCISGVLQTMDQVDDGSAINLSTGIFTSFVDFVETASDILGFKPEVKGTSNTPEGVFARGGDTSLQGSLGFTEKRSFRDGVENALNYYSI
ncbi:NAD-dependent epimerase/dehydratase family protein [Pontiellaceae bacterium B1224]|nr:NAD-dependent epimerase/dehydratase family protein [Pontiellaceae bacterium B1224]